MLLWTAALNGRPAVFPDTALYYSEGEYLLESLHLSAPSAEPAPRDPTRLPAVPGAPNASAAIDGARSPVYGLFLLGLQRAGGLWLAAYAQALAAAAVVFLLLRAAAPEPSAWRYLAVMAALALLSGLPVFAALAMPDVFTGVGLAAAILLAAYGDRLGGWTRAGVFALLAASLAMHKSNLVDAGLLAAVAAPVAAWSGVAWRRALGRAAAVGLAVVLALAVGQLAYRPMQARAGEPIASPPFLSARVLADGPGRGYLRRACRDAQPYALCRFAARPLADSDDILWAPRGPKGVFAEADPATRRRLDREDARFALAAVEAEPLGEAGAALRDSGLQFVEPFVDEALGDPARYLVDGYWKRTSLPAILPGARACRRYGPCASRIPPLAADIVQAAALLAALGLLGWRLSRTDVREAWRRRSGRDDERVRLVLASLLAVAALLINAAVCGALSGPFPRYQARIAWIVPLAAALVAARLGVALPRRRRGQGVSPAVS